MPKYNALYRRFIDEKRIIMPKKMVRSSFYLIKQYEYADGTKGMYSDATAPIIFTLYVSRSKDIVHAVKVSAVRPDLVKRFFGRLVNTDTELLEMKGLSRTYYKTVIKKVPFIKNNAYRTYKLSGFGKVLELDMDLTRLTPKSKRAEGINPSSQKQNR
jgi:hypothetical protein